MHIEVKKVGKSYALHNISFTLKSDEMMAVLGPSGSGKSTLLKILAGLVQPDNGCILLDGEPMPRDERALIAHRRTIGTVFQAYNLFPHLTALQNIALPLHRVHDYTQAEADRRSKELLKRFQLIDHAHKTPGHLSGGQNQRVAIIRALAIRPKILLLDEPTSALDPLMTAEVLTLIEELKAEGQQLLLVTHHIPFVKEMADTIAYLDKGTFSEITPSKTFFSSPKSPQAKRYLQTA